MNSNAALGEDRQALLSVLQNALVAFGRIPGVTAIGLGRRTLDDDTSPVVLRVTVAEGLPLGDGALVEGLPPQFEGLPTLLCRAIPSIPIADPVLVGGLQLDSSRASPSTGTLGCLATTSDGKAVILTAAHVIYGPGEEPTNSGEVGAPNRSCCWPCTTGVIGTPLKGIINSQLDCGLIALNGKRPTQQIFPGLGPDKNGDWTDRIRGVAPLQQGKSEKGQILSLPVFLDDYVRKVGATTGPTRGKVKAVDYAIPADPEAGVPAMTAQIVIVPLQGERFQNKRGKVDFCEHGDSGAVVIDDNNRIVGLLIRAADLTGMPGVGDWTGFGGVATDIHRVMTALGVSDIPASSPSTQTRQTGALVPGGAIFRSPKLTGQDLQRRAVFELLKAELSKFELGRRLGQFIDRHQVEISLLVNHHRRVTVVWHRAHGPALVALLLRDLRDLDQPIPQSFASIPAATTLASVRDALEEYGSPELVQDIRDLWPNVSTALTESRTLSELVTNLRRVSAHE